MKNYYEELEVSRSASDEVINKAYKVLAKKYHPDSTNKNKEIAEERLKNINEAYEILSNKEKRQEYDKELISSEYQIDINEYNRIIEINRRLTIELENLKQQQDSLNDSNFNNVDNHYNNRYNSMNFNLIITNLKSKIPSLINNILALILTIGALVAILLILLFIPFTKQLVIDTFKIFLN